MSTYIADIWSAFFAYWLISGAFARLGKRILRRGQSRFADAVEWTVYGVAIWIGLYSREALWNRYLAAPNVTTTTVGIAVTVFALLLAVWARITLGAQWSGVIQRAEHHQLITAGPYRCLRNPIYTGIFVAFLGTFLARPTIGMATAVSGMLLCYLFRIPREEAFLRQQFGDEYRHYCRTTWRFFPFLY